MQATLYLPQQPPQDIPADSLGTLDLAARFKTVPQGVPVLLGCTPELVDVLASGPDYVAYSVFDCEGPINHAAMVAVTKVLGVMFDAEDEDMVLCGPVLVVSAFNSVI